MLGLGGFVGMVKVRVRSWGMHHAYGSPHKDESTRILTLYIEIRSIECILNDNS